MRVEIETAVEIGKGVSIKREKAEDDTEVVIAHLKFAGGKVQYEVIDELCCQPIGWAQHSFFNELGAPVAPIIVDLPRFAAEATGKIRGIQHGESITLTQADIDGVTLTLCDNGALLAADLAWKIAGDEASDLEPLLGRLCGFHVVVQDAEQGDMLKQKAAA